MYSTVRRQYARFDHYIKIYLNEKQLHAAAVALTKLSGLVNLENVYALQESANEHLHANSDFNENRILRTGQLDANH